MEDNNEKKKKNTKTTSSKTNKKSTTNKSTNVNTKETKPKVRKKKESVPEGRIVEIPYINLEETNIHHIITNKETGQNYYAIVEKERKHIFLKLLVYVLSIILIALIVYKFVIHNPKIIFTNGINTTLKYITSYTNYFDISSIKSNEINGVLKLYTNNEEYKKLENYDIDLNIDTVLKDHNYKINANVNNLVDLSYYYLNNNFYVEYNNLYNNSILLKNNYDNIKNILDKINYVDINQLNSSLNTIKNRINSKISNNALITESDKLGDYVSINLTKEEFANIISTVISELKDNHSLIKKLANAFNTEELYINEFLDNILKEALIKNFETMEIKFYYEGYMADIKGMNISFDNVDRITIINNNVNININDYIINIDCSNKYYITVTNNDKLIMEYTINTLKKELIDIDYNLHEYNYKGNFHFARYDKTNNKSGNLSFSLISKEETSSLNFDYRIKDIKALNLTKDFINIDNLNEEDYLEISNRINTKLKETPFDKVGKFLIEEIYNY